MSKLCEYSWFILFELLHPLEKFLVSSQIKNELTVLLEDSVLVEGIELWIQKSEGRGFSHHCDSPIVVHGEDRIVVTLSNSLDGLPDCAHPPVVGWSAVIVIVFSGVMNGRGISIVEEHETVLREVLHRIQKIPIALIGQMQTIDENDIPFEICGQTEMVLIQLGEKRVALVGKGGQIHVPFQAWIHAPFVAALDFVEAVRGVSDSNLEVVVKIVCAS
jgi:hypothetical protein